MGNAKSHAGTSFQITSEEANKSQKIWWPLIAVTPIEAVTDTWLTFDESRQTLWILEERYIESKDAPIYALYSLEGVPCLLDIVLHRILPLSLFPPGIIPICIAYLMSFRTWRLGVEPDDKLQGLFVNNSTGLPIFLRTSGNPFVTCSTWLSVTPNGDYESIVMRDIEGEPKSMSKPCDLIVEKVITECGGAHPIVLVRIHDRETNEDAQALYKIDFDRKTMTYFGWPFEGEPGEWDEDTLSQYSAFVGRSGDVAIYCAATNRIWHKLKNESPTMCSQRLDVFLPYEANTRVIGIYDDPKVLITTHDHCHVVPLHPISKADRLHSGSTILGRMPIHTLAWKLSMTASRKRKREDTTCAVLLCYVETRSNMLGIHFSIQIF